MSITQNQLRDSLHEYRKAFRAMLKFYDSSWSLYNLFDTQLNTFFENVKEINLAEHIAENWDIPSGVSDSAFQDVSTYISDWGLECYDDEKAKARKNSIYLSVFLLLDYWPLVEEPAESISAIEVTAYRVTNINGNATYTWDDLPEKFDTSDISKDSKIDEDANPKGPMPLTTYPNLWSSENGKYQGDCAIGLYDLADLIDENVVKDTVINDIKKLLTDWR